MNISARRALLRWAATIACWQAVGEQGAVGQMGERVVLRHVLHVLFHVLALGDVGGDAAQA